MSALLLFRHCPALKAKGQTQAILPIAFLWTGRHGALRAGPAGEHPATAYGTCLLVLQNCALGKTPQNPMPEMPANRGSPRVQPRSASSTCLRASGRKQREKPHFQIEIHFCGVPHLPGPEKTRASPRAVFPREGLLGLPLGLVLGFAQLIPTHQVTRGNQSRNSDYWEMEWLSEIDV
jgi:hypothetical protein